MEVRLVIDGVEVKLVPTGKSKSFEKFKEPPEVEGGVIASVYVKPGWKPAKGS